MFEKIGKKNKGTERGTFTCFPTKVFPVRNQFHLLATCGDCGNRYHIKRINKCFILEPTDFLENSLNFLHDLLLWFLNQNLPEVDKEMFRKYGKIYGKFEGTQPNLCINDAELIKSIFVKDFDHFINRRVWQKNRIKRKIFRNFFQCFISGFASERFESFPENAGGFGRSGMERCSICCHPHLHFCKNQTSTVELVAFAVE